MSMGKSPVVELRIGNYTVCVKHRLAEGGFGYVDLVFDTSSKVEYVLKRSGIERQEIYEIVKKEISILQRFAGPHVVKLLASDIIVVNKGKKEACLLLELCPGGHLLDRLSVIESKSLSPATLYKIFGQLLLAVKPFHESEPPVTHRDLKLENILFGSDGNVRLCDFGSCVIGNVPLRNVEDRTAAEEIISKETTQIYRSPELVDLYMRDALTVKSDIWALGCILYTLCYFLHPFQDMGSLGILNAKIVFPANIPINPDIKTLLLRMLDVDPEARPSIVQLLPAFSAIASGKPLPFYAIPPDAIERRKEREITAKKREEKNKISLLKKNPNKVTPQKPVGPLASNSVAARRLAMKKGGNFNNINNNESNGFPDESAHQSLNGNDNSPIFETNFSNNDTTENLQNCQQQSNIDFSNSTFGSTDLWGSSNEFSNNSNQFSNKLNVGDKDRNKDKEMINFDAFNNDFNSLLPPSYSSSLHTPSVQNTTKINNIMNSEVDLPPPYPTNSTDISTKLFSNAGNADDLFEWNDSEPPGSKGSNSQKLNLKSVNDSFVTKVFNNNNNNNNKSNIDAGFNNFSNSPKKSNQNNSHNDNSLFDFNYTVTSSKPLPTQNQSQSQSQSFSEFDNPNNNKITNNQNDINNFFDTKPIPFSYPSTDQKTFESTAILSPRSFIHKSIPPAKPIKPSSSTIESSTISMNNKSILKPTLSRQQSTPSPVMTRSIGTKSFSQPMLPSYELDLFDTTPGPPEIDFLSLETPDIFSTKHSTVMARQQANDVLALFDNGPGTGPEIPHSTHSDFLEGMGYGQGLNQGQGQGYGQQNQQHQQLQRAFGPATSSGSMGWGSSGGYSGLLSNQGVTSPTLPLDDLSGAVKRTNQPYKQRQ